MKRVAAGSVRRLLVGAGFLGVLVMIWGAGCSKEPPNAPDTNAPAGGQASGTAVETPQKPAEPPVDKVMATVNGVEIMESEVRRRVDEQFRPQLEKLAAQAPELAAQQEKLAMRNVLNEMVIRQLLDEQAKLTGVEVTEEQLLAEMNKQLAAATPPMTMEQYKQGLAAQGRDFEQMKGLLAQQMKYKELLEAQAGDRLNVTEEDAQKYYAENPGEFQVPEQVHASHILVSTEAKETGADPNQVKAQAREKAEALLQQVKDGADFATVAKENSSCPSAAQGGDLGFFGRDQMVKPFEETAFSLEPGAISDLVETQFGYHIIKVTEHRDPNTVAFATAKDDIMNNLKVARTREAFQDYVASLQQKAQITYPSGDAMPVPPRTPGAGAVRPERPSQTAPTDNADQG